MDNDHSADVISTFDCNILRDAFRTSVIENRIPEDQWHGYAALLIRDYTGNSDFDSALLAWIVRK
ncbi:MULTISPECIES: hypothetical protein [unclassified Mesorhizobium]|uniref:hypothetical protein n=1 Tax=unclassified Mesorhizobium TaxID=325217 RepID=UPI001127CF48|nr:MULTISPECIES: hypothetical protein [unclassified Mesorhizobium]MBZ9763394.1 hypothetical protein [Mesorhizobium sp. CA8]UCI33231.1 hypothetical protein FJW03_07310 [Mesorhizobium sp. B4-1-4]